MEPLLQKYKVLIIGNSSVGKTSLLLRHVEGKFTEEVAGTIGVDYRANTYVRDGQRYDLQIWDTAGQERFRNVTRAYYRDANAALLVFDVTNHNSFSAIEGWCQNLREQVGTGTDLIIILVGNKSDLPGHQVKLPEVQQLAEKLKISTYIQTSAKDGTRVNEVFEQLLGKLISKGNRGQSTKPGSITLGEGQRSEGKCCS